MLNHTSLSCFRSFLAKILYTCISRGLGGCLGRYESCVLMKGIVSSLWFFHLVMLLLAHLWRSLRNLFLSIYRSSPLLYGLLIYFCDVCYFLHFYVDIYFLNLKTERIYIVLISRESSAHLFLSSSHWRWCSYRVSAAVIGHFTFFRVPKRHKKRQKKVYEQKMAMEQYLYFGWVIMIRVAMYLKSWPNPSDDSLALM